MTNSPPPPPSPAPVPHPPDREPEPRSRARTYLGVVITEALVVAALWAFSRHFIP